MFPGQPQCLRDAIRGRCWLTAQQSDMGQVVQRQDHRFWLTLDVGEEEGDGAAGQIGHRPSPEVTSWQMLLRIVARAIIRDAAERGPGCRSSRTARADRGA